MKNFNFKLLEEKLVSEDGIDYIGYGILQEGSNGETKRYSDISLHKGEVEELIRKIYEYNVSSLHIRDIIDDFLAA